MKYLNESSDIEIIRAVVSERVSDLNPYTPLSKRLNEILKHIQQEKIKEIKS
jgi:hypothetical protein